MLGRETSSQVDTILGKDTDFNGVIHASKSLRIEGRFTGKIFSKGNILVGRNALVKGDINACNAIVSGEVRGNVFCTGCLEIAKHGRVYGDVNVGTLRIDDGAVFKGKSEMRPNVLQGPGRKPAQIALQQPSAPQQQQPVSLQPGTSMPPQPQPPQNPVAYDESQDTPMAGEIYQR